MDKTVRTVEGIVLRSLKMLVAMVYLKFGEIHPDLTCLL